jgi:alkylation response protein AidB-like acyl-CoA dehydrogenase
MVATAHGSALMNHTQETRMSPPAFERLLHKTHTLGREVLAVFAAEVDRDARFPREAIEAMRQARLLSAYVPEEDGA